MPHYIVDISAMKTVLATHEQMAEFPVQIMPGPKKMSTGKKLHKYSENFNHVTKLLNINPITKPI